ncbi:hypothetical protein GUITHDRAFT_162687 [Guillardia theta CCMP2712]|uniref:Rhamnosyl O-methyltransferase n=1 Tax=Guillardia theta (strain CCMP2712) TaxID=905079 RepID=L1JGV9_GUITC|nr:hypothetical protein GUITHDRAFT_162687 [Guillardia theta CCMP2712]EKX47310.1 hypothetical protein GUITHDRAFT_162687 [Guillardia theta CCMP2712]|eukprot:XP_005834290.1 hypothetical protein GUITHDRAFT_162687 [Guillardia theta CCMP2712]
MVRFSVILLTLGVFFAGHGSSLEFRIPKDGRSYDTSEAVFLFERSADEDGFAVLEVDGRIIRTFEEKQLEYEVSIMGQQVGMHSATVRLFELPHGEEGNVELKNLSVSYFIAEPGTGSTGVSLPTLSGGEERMLETARSHIIEAVRGLEGGGDMGNIAEHLRLMEEWPVQACIPDRSGDQFEEAQGRAGGAEACPSEDEHELSAVFRQIHPQNPYSDFDSTGLTFSAGEHQGHDTNMMASLIHLTQPKLIIEVGSWKGGSAIQMGSVLRAKGWGCRTKIICVDTWLGTSTDLKSQRLPLKNGYPTVQREFMHNIISSGFSSVVIPIAAPANIASKYLKYLLDREDLPLADLIFIDGNHDYDDVKADIANYFPILSPKGIMFGDDYGWAGVKKAVDEFASSRNMTVFSPGGRTWLIA